MKRYLRLAGISIIVAFILFAVYVVKRAAAPESAIISKERDRIYAEADKNQMEKDPIYARNLQDKLQFLDYRLAIAHNAENKPDAAIAVLQKLISEEAAKGKSGIPRRSRSYENEARYYEALKESFDLKQDEAGAKKASESRAALMAKAAELKKVESREEGKALENSGE